jgi:hypothetical protein
VVMSSERMGVMGFEVWLLSQYHLQWAGLRAGILLAPLRLFV